MWGAEVFSGVFISETNAHPQRTILEGLGVECQPLIRALQMVASHRWSMDFSFEEYFRCQLTESRAWVKVKLDTHMYYTA